MSDRPPPRDDESLFDFDALDRTSDGTSSAVTRVESDAFMLALAAAETPTPPGVAPDTRLSAPPSLGVTASGQESWSISPAMTTSLLERAKWLEDEARLQKDQAHSARLRVAASEMYAIAGDRTAAAVAAREAYNIASKSSIVQRQWRGLREHTADDLAAEVEALDAEAKLAATGHARIHSALMAAELLRKHGDEDGASKRWEQVIRLSPHDPRAPLARVIRSLSRNDTGALALRVPDVNELAPIVSAINAMLRLRGIDRKAAFDEGSAVADALGRTRTALAKADLAAAATHIATLESVPELSRATRWLGAALGGRHENSRERAAHALKALVEEGIEEARPALAAHGLELENAELVHAAMEGSDAFTPSERVVLSTLSGRPEWLGDGELANLAETPVLVPLVASINPLGGAGDGPSKFQMIFARQVARGGRPKLLKEITAEFERMDPPRGQLFALEMAYQRGDTHAVALGLMGWKEVDEDDLPRGARDRSFAAAICHDVANDSEAALAFYNKALALDATCPAARGAVVRLNPTMDLRRALRTAAEILGPGTAGAFTWLEADARSLQSTDMARELLLEYAHRAAPSLPFAAYLATERARYEGRIDHAVRWIHARREFLSDPLEMAVDLAREAFWIRSRDADAARERLAMAHALRPNDIALRIFLESHDPNPPDFAKWREARAATLTGVLRTHLLLEAAYAYELAGNAEGFLRVAQTATKDSHIELSRVMLERAELRAGVTTRLAEELIEISKNALDSVERREAYERLAELNLYGRRDAASALLWHRAIVEEFPSHKPSLRYLEHQLMGEGRDDELRSIAATIARALRKLGDLEGASHAEFVVQMNLAGSNPYGDETRAMVELVATDPSPPLSLIHARCALALVTGDGRGYIDALQVLIRQTEQPYEIASLCVRAGMTARQIGLVEDGRSLLDRATQQDPDDAFAWKLLAESVSNDGDHRGAALAYENLARVSAVGQHQLEAWYEAGRIWQDLLNDAQRSITALEQAAGIDLGFRDTFGRLTALCREHDLLPQLASLLERRLPTVTDPDERVTIALEWSRVLVAVGSLQTARTALEEALAVHPDHPAALKDYAQLAETLADWETAEESWIRLARLLTDPHDQKLVYTRLGELYATHLANPTRAEVAFLEVLKRDSTLIPTIEQLVSIYIQQGNFTRVIEMQQKLVQLARNADERRQRLLELSAYFDNFVHDPRKAEQALETARRELPSDVIVLRALVDLYMRHKQLPAVHIVLDRTAADVRRAFAAGRFTGPLFDVMATVYELRGRGDAARVALASRDALEGESIPIEGAGSRAGDLRLDELLSPELLSPAFRQLLSRTGDALEVATPLDLRALSAAALPASHSAVHALIQSLATGMGFRAVQVLVSSAIGGSCIPASSRPPVLILGAPLLAHASEGPLAFLIMRALKLLQVGAAPFARSPELDLPTLFAAWLQTFNPNWQPANISPGPLAEAGRRIRSAMPKGIDSQLGTIALEVAGLILPQIALLRPSVIAWGNRTALLAIGNVNAAFEAIAHDINSAIPYDLEARAEWITQTEQARDLLAFTVTDAYNDARTQLLLGQ